MADIDVDAELDEFLKSSKNARKDRSSDKNKGDSYDKFFEVVWSNFHGRNADDAVFQPLSLYKQCLRILSMCSSEIPSLEGVADLAQQHIFEHSAKTNVITSHFLKKFDVQLPRIESDVGITKDAIIHLASNPNYKVTFLNLTTLQLYDSKMNLGSYLVKMKHLKHLVLKKQAIKAHDCSCIAKLPELEYLDVSKTRINDKGLCALAKCKKLEHVFFRECRFITDDGMKVFLNGVQTLITLDISKTKISCDGLTYLPDQSNLKRMNVSHSLVDENCLQYVQVGVTHLNLHGIVIRSESNLHFLLSILPDLEELDCDGGSRNYYQFIEALRGLEKMKRLVCPHLPELESSLEWFPSLECIVLCGIAGYCDVPTNTLGKIVVHNGTDTAALYAQSISEHKHNIQSVALLSKFLKIKCRPKYDGKTKQEKTILSMRRKSFRNSITHYRPHFIDKIDRKISHLNIACKCLSVIEYFTALGDRLLLLNNAVVNRTIAEILVVLQMSALPFKLADAGIRTLWSFTRHHGDELKAHKNYILSILQKILKIYPNNQKINKDIEDIGRVSEIVDVEVKLPKKIAEMARKEPKTSFQNHRQRHEHFQHKKRNRRARAKGNRSTISKHDNTERDTEKRNMLHRYWRKHISILNSIKIAHRRSQEYFRERSPRPFLHRETWGY